MNNVEKTLEFLKRYNFTDVRKLTETSATVYADFRHTRLYAYISLYDDVEVGVCFYGEVIKNQEHKYYRLGNKKHYQALCTRARRFMKLTKEKDDVAKKEHDVSNASFTVIHDKLIEAKVAFTLQISKSDYNDGQAVIKVNGYKLAVDKDLTSRVRIGHRGVRVPIQKAMELAELMPPNKDTV